MQKQTTQNIKQILDKLLQQLKLRKKPILLIMLVVVALAGYTIYGKYKQANPSSLYTIVYPEYNDLIRSITVSGEIKSGSEIDLAPQASGRLTNLYVSIGQAVSARELLAQVENSSQRAQLTQALGALKSAQAQLASAQAQLQKVANGSTLQDKNIATGQVSAAESALNSARATARNVLQTAYAGTVSTILLGTDVAIDNANTATPTLKFNTTKYAAKLAIENARVPIGDIVARHKKQSAYSVSDADLLSELEKVHSELLQMQGFADNLLLALNGAITSSTVPASLISSYTSTVSTARTQMLANIAAITSADNAVVAAQRAVLTSKDNKDKVFVGSRAEDVDVAAAGVQAAEAAVLSAEGNYQAAKASLDKTYIRSPQNGVIADIYKDAGELVQTTMPVVKIISKDVYVSALVSEVDITKIRTGVSVSVKLDALPERVFDGVINFIYPDKVERLGIIYYEVSIKVPGLESSGLTILPGMSLDVMIPYESQEGALSIERSIINKDGDKYFVYILNPEKNKPIDEKFAKLYFINGFIGDSYIEIIEGLSKDTGVVKFTKEE